LHPELAVDHFSDEGSFYGGVTAMDVMRIVIGIVVFISLSVTCLWLLARIEQALTVQRHVVRLSNLGNCTSIFRLSVVPVEQIFSFRFLLNDNPLSPVSQVESPQLPAETNSTGAGRITPGAYTVQTQPVEPRATLSVPLQVKAAMWSYPTGTYAYTLSSQQLPVDLLAGEEPPVTIQGVLHFPSGDVWPDWLAPVASLLVVAIWILILFLVFRSLESVARPEGVLWSLMVFR
jgi:hypothetical protein